MAMDYKYKLVLLIDDSYIDNLISRKILENNYFAEKIEVIDSPQRAISHLRNCLGSKQDIPEVVFLDIRMPEMNGFDFLKEINSIPGIAEQNIKIFVLSSSLDPTDLKKIEDHQLVTKFIGKPLSNHALEGI
jgi:CheY-like chemotaxis protein